MLNFSFNFNLFNNYYYLYERLLVLFFSLVPAILLVIFILYTDRESKEPAKNIVLCLLSGILTIALASNLESYVLPLFNNNVVVTYVFAMIEELSKMAIFLLFLFDNKYFDDIYDGIVYMSLIALSFAGVENIMYAFSESTVSSSISLALMRDLTTIPLHVICGVVIGFFLALASFSKLRGKKYLNILLAILISTFMHGTFNNFMTLLSKIDVSSNDTVKTMLFLVLPLILIMIALLYVAYVVIQKTVNLNRCFINNKKYDEKFSYLMNKDDYLNSSFNKNKEKRYNILKFNKTKKEEVSDNKKTEDTNKENIVSTSNDQKVIEESTIKEEVLNEKTEEQLNSEVEEKIDEIINFEIEKNIVLNNSKKKQFKESKKRRLYYKNKSK